MSVSCAPTSLPSHRFADGYCNYDVDTLDKKNQCKMALQKVRLDHDTRWQLLAFRRREALAGRICASFVPGFVLYVTKQLLLLSAVRQQPTSV